MIRSQKMPLLECITLLLCSLWGYTVGLSCPDGEWRCLDGSKCIKQKYVCNANPSCADGSDEDPAVCAEWNCTAGYWKCQSDLWCIKDYRVCDGKNSCTDWADEDDLLCAQWNCPANRWLSLVG